MMEHCACGASVPERPVNRRQMKFIHWDWLLAVGCMAIFAVGCQSFTPTPTVTATPFLDSTPKVETVNPPSTPTATASSLPAPTIQPASTPTSLPVYTAITVQNAGRLAEWKSIEFGLWSQIISLEWAPDGRFLAVSAGNQLNLIDPHTWDIAAQVNLAASSPGLAISPDSRYLAAASRDGRLSVWEVGSDDLGPLTLLYSVDAHRKGANQVVFSPDGLWLASGGNDGIARVRRVEDGEEVAQIIGGSYAVSDLAFSPDGDWLAIVNSNLIRLRKPDSGVMGLTLQTEQPLFCLAFSPDGRWLAAGDSASQVLLWDLENDPAVRVVGEHGGRSGRIEALVWQVDFHPGGELLVSAGGDGVVRIWDVFAGELLAALSGHGGAADQRPVQPGWAVVGDG